LVQSENQQQASDQVSISNSIGSLRLLSAIDWREFVETISVVEKNTAPGSARCLCAMELRPQPLPSATERIAKAAGSPKRRWPRRAIPVARASVARRDATNRAAHVGFYLIDRGLPELEQAAAVEVPWCCGTRIARRFPLLLYLGAIAGNRSVLSAAWSRTPTPPE